MPIIRAFALLACLGASALFATPVFAQPQADRAQRPVQAPKLEPISDVTVDRDQDTVPDRKDQVVRIQGVVSTPSTAFGEGMFQAFVQDESGGLMLYSRSPRAPLAQGERIEVMGRVRQFRGAIQLQDLSIRPLGRTTAPAPIAAEVADADSWKHMGTRVTIEGIAGAPTLDTFGRFRLTGDDGASISVFVPPQVTRTIDWKLVPRGARVQATGVASIYKHTWPYDGGFQLVLTDANDLHLLEPPVPAWHAWAIWAAAASCLLLGIALLVFYLLQRRQKARARELATLSALSNAFSTPDIGQEQLARHACEILTAYGVADAALVHMYDEHGRLRQLAAAAADPMVSVSLQASEPLPAMEVTDNGAQRVIEARMSQKGLTLLSVHSLLAKSGTQGFLAALSPHKRRQSDMQERTLVSAVKLLALALENSRVQERARIEQQELQQLVVTDELTKLYNRRFLEEYLRVQIPLALRRGSGLGFISIDIDHFKTINDTYGHDAGDRVLAGVAARLREAMRSSDLPVRMGGEEFLMLVGEHDAPGTMVIAERLRESVESHVFTDAVEGKDIRVTVSIGIALFGMHGNTAAALLRASDEAMYASKRAGRNRSTLAAYVEAVA